MKERENAVRALIQGVVALSEATRVTAAHGPEDMDRLQELEQRAQEVMSLVSGLRGAIQAEVPFAALPVAPAPEGHSVESLDELFGKIESSGD